MTDPDVPDGACICRPVDNIMAMGHAHYCVNNARNTAFGTRLPANIEQMIVEAAADPTHHAFRRRQLEFDGNAGMRDAFMEALRSPDMHVYEDRCEDDPGEIVVRARGESIGGSYWRDINIILLQPWWSRDSEKSQTLAEDIVTLWEKLQAATQPARH